jgi:hypothetical protein
VLVPAVEVPVGPGQFPYEAEATWYEPDHAAAVQALRSVLDDPAAAGARADRARARVLADFSSEQCGAIWRDRVAALRADRARAAVAENTAPATALRLAARVVSRMRAWRR